MRSPLHLPCDPVICQPVSRHPPSSGTAQQSGDLAPSSGRSRQSVASPDTLRSTAEMTTAGWVDPHGFREQQSEDDGSQLFGGGGEGRAGAR